MKNINIINNYKLRLSYTAVINPTIIIISTFVLLYLLNIPEICAMETGEWNNRGFEILSDSNRRQKYLHIWNFKSYNPDILVMNNRAFVSRGNLSI